MANEVTIGFEIQYIDCELAAESVESKPRLKTFVDGHFIRSDNSIIDMDLDEHDLSKVYKGTLQASALGSVVPDNARIGFASYAMVCNDGGGKNYVRVGSAFLPISEVTAHCKTSEYMFEKELPLVIETTRMFGGPPVEKGKILFRVTSLSTGSNVKFARTLECNISDSVASSGNITRVLEARSEFVASFGDTFPGTQRVRMPMNLSTSGFYLTTDSPLPVESFVMLEGMHMNVDYFQNTFELVMKQRGLNATIDFDNMPLPRKAEIMADMMTFVVQSYQYVPDSFERSSRQNGPYNTAGHVATDDWNNALSIKGNGGHDCEDLDKGAEETAGAFRLAMVEASPLRHAHASFNDHSIDKKRYPQLHLLQRIMRNYVTWSTLATVHGAKAEDKAEHLGAHMYGLYTPIRQCRKALQNNPRGRDLLARVELTGDMIDEPLPTLFGEGTGRVRSLGTGPIAILKDAVRSATVAGVVKDHPHSFDPLINERRYASIKMTSSRRIGKMELPHDMGGKSTFYHGNLELATPFFLQQRVGHFICGNIDPETKEITRGVPFIDIINQENNFAIIPLPELSQDIMVVMQEALTLREPAPAYLFDKTKPMSGTKVHPELEKLKLATKGRTGMAPHGPIDKILMADDVTAANVKAIARDIQQMDACFKVEYDLQQITNDMHRYRIMFYLDEEAVKSE